MAYNIQTIARGRIIHLCAHDHITVQEVRRMYDALMIQLSYARDTAHVLLDHTGVKSFPLRLSAYSYIPSQQPPRNLGWVVVAGANPKTKFMGLLFCAAAHAPARAAHTYRDALDCLYQLDDTLGADVQTAV